MSFTAPYNQNHYMGEHTNDANCLTFIRAAKWDSSGNGTGDPINGMTYYNTTSNTLLFYNGSTWVAVVTSSALAGTSFPASPYDGQPFFRTDLDAQFWYDGGRSKWLGQCMIIHAAKEGSLLDDTYMRTIDGLVFSATTGYYIPFDGTVVGITYHRGDTDTGTFEVRRNGVLVIGIAAGTTNNGSDMTLNSNFAADGVLSAYWSSSNNTVDACVCVMIRRRAT